MALSRTTHTRREQRDELQPRILHCSFMAWRLGLFFTDGLLPCAPSVGQCVPCGATAAVCRETPSAQIRPARQDACGTTLKLIDYSQTRVRLILWRYHHHAAPPVGSVLFHSLRSDSKAPRRYRKSDYRCGYVQDTNQNYKSCTNYTHTVKARIGDMAYNGAGAAKIGACACRVANFVLLAAVPLLCHQRILSLVSNDTATGGFTLTVCLLQRTIR